MLHFINKKTFSFNNKNKGEKSNTIVSTPSNITYSTGFHITDNSTKDISNDFVSKRASVVVGPPHHHHHSNAAVAPASVITPNTLFNIARSRGTFSPNLLIKNGFAIGNYFRYWQNLFDLRPCPSIYAITVTYEILGKEGTQAFLLKNFEDKFFWLHNSMPLGSMYVRAHGPTTPPTTIEMMYAFGEEAWSNGHGECLVQYTRNADEYVKEIFLKPLDLTKRPPLNLDMLIQTISSIIY